MDPIKSGGNWYVYCANNPLKYVDPNGLELRIGIISKNFMSKESRNTFYKNIITSLQTIDPTVSVDKSGIVTNGKVAADGYEKGHQLISSIVNGEQTVTINATKNMENNNYDEAKNKVNIFGQYMVTGVSGPTVDSDGNAVNSKFLLLSVLAHELIHASHDINGGTADGWKGPYIGLDGKKYACSNEEYNTLFGNGSGSVSENDIRSEQGQNLRAGYNEDYSMWKIGF